MLPYLITAQALLLLSVAAAGLPAGAATTVLGAPSEQSATRIPDTLKEIRFKNVRFEESPIEDCLDFLRTQTAAQDKPIQFVFKDELKEPPLADLIGKWEMQPAIISRLILCDITLADLLQHICRTLPCEMVCEQDTVTLIRRDPDKPQPVHRRWNMSPRFTQFLIEEGRADLAVRHPHSTSHIKEFLIDTGVHFSPESSAEYDAAKQQLSVCTTEEEIEHIESLLKQCDPACMQAENQQTRNKGAQKGKRAYKASEEDRRIARQLDDISIASVDFIETYIEDALDFLRAETRKAGRPVNFVYVKNKKMRRVCAVITCAVEGEETKTNHDVARPKSIILEQGPPPAAIGRLKLANVSVRDTLNCICMRTSCKMTIANNAVILTEQDKNDKQPPKSKRSQKSPRSRLGE